MDSSEHTQESLHEDDKREGERKGVSKREGEGQR